MNGLRLTVDGLDLNDPGVKLDGVAMAATLRSEWLTRGREAYARRLLEARLPRPLHFLLDRPKALGRLLRLVPRWRPTMTYIECRDGMDGHGGRFRTMNTEAARHFAQVWIEGAPEQGGASLNGGLVFTYIDPSGLPAEVYGDLI